MATCLTQPVALHVTLALGICSRLLACVPSGLPPLEVTQLHTEDEEGGALLLATDKVRQGGGGGSG